MGKWDAAGIMPKIGLVMCNHNRGAYLQQAIDSVINQTFTDWRLIIWDNNSIDNSRSVLEHVRDSRISIVYGKTNDFPNCQRNALYSLDCDYLGIVDSDDRLIPDCLEQTVNYLDSHDDVGMVYTDYFEIGQFGDRRGLGHRCGMNYSPELILKNHIVFHFKLFRKHCHDAIGGINADQKLAVDWEFTIRFSEKFTIENLPVPLYEHRIHNMSVTQSRSVEQDYWSKTAMNDAQSRIAARLKLL